MYYPDWEVQARIEDFEADLARRKGTHEHARSSTSGVRTRIALALASLAQKLEPRLGLVIADAVETADAS